MACFIMEQEFKYKNAVTNELKSFRIIVKTFKGLEDVLEEELRQLGADNIKPLKRGVECTGDLRMLYKINLRCRTALKVLKPIHTFEAKNADEVYDEIKKYDWDSLLGIKNTIAISSVVYSDFFAHSKFVTYRVKDGIVDYFSDKYNDRPSVRVSNPDFQFNLHIAGTSCTLSLDSSGESLHKRGWRKEQTEAPLSEVLAAGLILQTGWTGDSDFYDPMCGSGTFLIEAAMIACNIAPGLYRESFGFEKWSDFDQTLFSELYDDDSEEREFKYKIFGSDVSPAATKIAEVNIRSAGLGKHIDLETRSLQRTIPREARGVLVTNPPYGERLKLHDMKNLYSIIGERLKHAFSGFNAWVLGYQEESFFAIGLRPSRKIEVKNGDLDCQFRKYELYAGTKKIHKLVDQDGVDQELSEKKPYERKPVDGSDDRKPFEGKSVDRKPMDGKRPEVVKKPYEKKDFAGGKKHFDRRSDDRKTYDHKSQDDVTGDEKPKKKHWDRGSDEHKAYLKKISENKPPIKRVMRKRKKD